MNRNWLYVFIGGVLEVIWVSGLKHATVWWEWAITIATIVVSFDLIIRAAKKLPLGTVYAVFTGLGTGGTVIAETLIFGEPFSWLKAFFILLLLSGVMGLKLVTDKESHSKKGADI
ncbi:multidrug efflux SMR transporter [Paenibacillus albiflavus]|uniref:Multidrug efflux SMR transporter n=1 Tax=Paenibacillus albiflavus TaxID=2545760 RepID=A0A4R4EH56_9BACL|nr:multidrug efflux SMR transporter [Paenibacillus albiflavus]TCZ78967.1 multidrug efflux SMR transporter [Paenibacillus albiflavus]